ncbi:MAG: WYL domain-containing protein [Ruminococcaceae bacterium]|nr:WYL domain-containing protein [Oscillospiraceae bacterium]
MYVPVILYNGIKCEKEVLSMENTKQERVLEIFFRALRGEDIFVRKLADEYGVSTKSISRNINDLKSFFAEHRDLVGNTELEYSYRDKCYRLYMDEFLTNKELFAIIEVMIGARAFSEMELLALVEKLKRFTTAEDRPKLNELIRRELYHYSEVKHDCKSVQENLWQLVNCISDKREVSIEYYKMDRSWVTHRLRPVSVMFTDYYFYLIAFKADAKEMKPVYFRVDRIKHITEHRKKLTLSGIPDFDEGLLRNRSLFMWPGKLRTIRFEFSGPSLQAVLDKLPTAKVIERMGGNKYLIEAETYGDGIKMWLLSQGSWVKVISPAEFADDMKNIIKEMYDGYNE